MELIENAGFPLILFVSVCFLKSQPLGDGAPDHGTLLLSFSRIEQRPLSDTIGWNTGKTYEHIEQQQVS